MEYKQQQNILNYEKINDLIHGYPQYLYLFVDEYRGNHASSRTILGYVRDIELFFYYLKQIDTVPDEHLVTADVLSDLQPYVINSFKGFLTSYKKDGKAYTNGREATNRKLISLRMLYDFLYRMDLIKQNPCAKVSLVKLKGEDKHKDIIALDDGEVTGLMNAVTTLDGLDEASRKASKSLALRDLAIVTLLLSTGMRVSECVGLNLEDVSYDAKCVRIIRKGHSKGQMIHINDETALRIREYVDLERKDSETDPDALFISRAGQRITVRSVERLVKKYASASGIISRVTPHKLRSTYGTALYEATRDLNAVATRLGHESTDTAKQRYVRDTGRVDEDSAKVVLYRKTEKN